MIPVLVWTHVRTGACVPRAPPPSVVATAAAAAAASAAAAAAAAVTRTIGCRLTSDLDAELLLQQRLLVRRLLGARVEHPGAHVDTRHAAQRDRRSRVTGLACPQGRAARRAPPPGWGQRPSPSPAHPSPPASSTTQVCGVRASLPAHTPAGEGARCTPLDAATARDRVLGAEEAVDGLGLGENLPTAAPQSAPAATRLRRRCPPGRAGAALRGAAAPAPVPGQGCSAMRRPNARLPPLPRQAMPAKPDHGCSTGEHCASGRNTALCSKPISPGKKTTRPGAFDSLCG